MKRITLVPTRAETWAAKSIDMISMIKTILIYNNNDLYLMPVYMLRDRCC